MRRFRLTIAALCILAGLCLVGVHLWVSHVTATGRPRALWRITLPGLDIGVDSSPAAPGQAGYADDYVPLLRLPGAPGTHCSVGDICS
jgi:hypothetical protein